MTRFRPFPAARRVATTGARASRLASVATLALVVLAGVALSSCGSTEPTPAPTRLGVWVLQTAANQPMPALIDTDVDPVTGVAIEVYVVSDTIQWLDGDHYVQSAHVEGRMNGQVIGRQRWYDRGIITLTGDSAHFDSEYIQNVAFDAALAGGALSVTQDLGGQGTTNSFVFRRSN